MSAVFSQLTSSACLQVTRMQKEKAEAQAAFNAKVAAENKNQADLFAMALAKANAEKAALEQQKVWSH